MKRLVYKQSRMSVVKDAFRRIGIPLEESRVPVYASAEAFHYRDAAKTHIFNLERLSGEPQEEMIGNRSVRSVIRDFFYGDIQEFCHGGAYEYTLPSGERMQLNAQPEKIGSRSLMADFKDFRLRVIESEYTVECREVQGDGAMVIAPDFFEMQILFSKNTSDALNFLIECTGDKDHHYTRHILEHNPATGLYSATLRRPERFEDLEEIGMRLSGLIESVSGREDLVKAAEARPAIGELKAAAGKLNPERGLTADIRNNMLVVLEGFEGMVRDALDSIANNEAKDSALGSVRDRL